MKASLLLRRYDGKDGFDLRLAIGDSDGHGIRNPKHEFRNKFIMIKKLNPKPELMRTSAYLHEDVTNQIYKIIHLIPVFS